MITKTELIGTMDNLPENLTIDQVIDHLIFVQKTQNGIADSENGLTNTKKEAKEKLRRWLNNLDRYCN